MFLRNNIKILKSEYVDAYHNFSCEIKSMINIMETIYNYSTTTSTEYKLPIGTWTLWRETKDVIKDNVNDCLKSINTGKFAATNSQYARLVMLARLEPEISQLDRLVDLLKILKEKTSIIVKLFEDCDVETDTTSMLVRRSLYPVEKETLVNSRDILEKIELYVKSFEKIGYQTPAETNAIELKH